MTLAGLYLLFERYWAEIALAIAIAPWVTWLLCLAIPGRREEPFLLSANLSLAVLSLLLLAGYLAYATATAGWSQVVGQANILLLFAPLYYLMASIWVARQRLPLSRVPAFRALQGLALMAGAYVVLAWFASRVRFVFFSYIPLTTMLWLLAGVVALGYFGYLRLRGGLFPKASRSRVYDDGQQLRASSRGRPRWQIIVPAIAIGLAVALWGAYRFGDGEAPSFRNAPGDPSSLPESPVVPAP